MSPSEEHSRALREFLEHVGHLDELSLVVLKGHLVLEQSLDRITSRFVFHPAHLETANLRFYQKMELVRSLSMDEAENHVWGLISAVNALRNQLAHSLDQAGRTKKMDTLRAKYFEMYAPEELAHERDLDDHLIAGYAIALSNGFLSQFEAEANRFERPR